MTYITRQPCLEPKCAALHGVVSSRRASDPGISPIGGPGGDAEGGVPRPATCRISPASDALGIREAVLVPASGRDVRATER